MRKYSAEDKLRMVKLILEAKHSITSVSTGEGIHPTTLEEWIRNYQSMGSETFYNKDGPKELLPRKRLPYKSIFLVLVHYVIFVKNIKFPVLVHSGNGLRCIMVIRN